MPMCWECGQLLGTMVPIAPARSRRASASVYGPDFKGLGPHHHRHESNCRVRWTSGSGFRRTRRLRDTKNQDDGTKPDLIAVQKPPRLCHPFSSDKGSVLAAQVLQCRFAVADDDARMVA